MARRHFKPGQRVYRCIVIDNLGDEDAEDLTVVQDHGDKVRVRADNGREFEVAKADLHTSGPG